MIKGFTLGTWDLLHPGHVELLRRARLMCEHLTVGVLAPEVLEVLGKPKPIMTPYERCEMLRAVEHVDQVVMVTNPDMIELWKLYTFRYLIVGKDWQGKLSQAAELEKLSRIVYLPRTPRISSTGIRQRVIAAFRNSIAAGQSVDKPPVIVEICETCRAYPCICDKVILRIDLPAAVGGTAALPAAVGGTAALPATCRVCGCTDLNCNTCVERTGAPCHWVEPDLCSACAQ